MTIGYKLLLLVTGIILFVGLIILKNIFTSKLAEKRGDFTPKSLGFNEANLLTHIDLLGLLHFITSGVGWEKRIEFERTQLNKIGLDLILIFILRQVFHGVMIIIALIILEIMSIPPISTLSLSIGYTFIFELLLGFIATNGILAIFSLIPFAPFDLFYLIRDLVPGKIAFWLDSAEQYTPWIVALILSPYSPIFPIIGAIRIEITQIVLTWMI